MFFYSHSLERMYSHSSCSLSTRKNFADNSSKVINYQYYDEELHMYFKFIINSFYIALLYSGDRVMRYCKLLVSYVIESSRLFFFYFASLRRFCITKLLILIRNSSGYYICTFIVQ